MPSFCEPSPPGKGIVALRSHPQGDAFPSERPEDQTWLMTRSHMVVFPISLLPRYKSVPLSLFPAVDSMTNEYVKEVCYVSIAFHLPSQKPFWVSRGPRTCWEVTHRSVYLSGCRTHLKSSSKRKHHGSPIWDPIFTTSTRSQSRPVILAAS